MPGNLSKPFDAIVIGSGFGGAVAITKLVDKGLPGKPRPRILVLERGTWWRNPEGPGLRSDKHVSMTIRGEWQYWARPNDAQGLAYVAGSIYKEHDPLLDVVNPFFRDNDLGIRRNRKGMYRLTRFSHRNGNVDVVSGSAVGGGSLFYSGVNLIPHKPVLDRIGLGYLTSADFRETGKWMKQFRGPINKINTKIPVPHYAPQSPQPSAYQLSHIPESGDTAVPVNYEMPNPELDEHDGYLLLDRARVLRRAMNRVCKSGGFVSNGTQGQVWARDGASGHDGFEPLPLSVVEYEKDAASKAAQTNTFCTRDGRCILGCLPSARHTLYKTIQNRIEAGDDITVLPLTKVSHVSKRDGMYTVQFETNLDGEDADVTSARASRVFFAAGCLGTTEILLRSSAKFADTNGAEGLALSTMVGQKFSTNGDFFAFTWNMDRDYKTRREVPETKRIGNANSTKGPINSSHFYVTFGDGRDRVDVNVEDAGVPSSFARLVHTLLPKFSNWQQFWSLARGLTRLLLNRNPFPITEAPDTEAREQTDYLTEHELLSGVFFYNLMGSGPNEPFGTFSLQRDGSGLDLAFEDDRKLAAWSVFEKQTAILKQLTDHMEDAGDPDRKPELMLSPFWQKDQRVTVVHPLGGCPIGTSRSLGVVDQDGRVYDGDGANETSVHEGLYVIDAAAIPGALAVNPTYTIVTHALRCMNKIVES